VVLHHVICDGWSLTVLMREVGALYVAFAAGRPSPLAELPIQYADFATWQRGVVAASRQTELAYWLDRLGGEVAPLELPTDRPRPPVQTYDGGQGTLLLSPGLAGRLTAFGRDHGATLFMTLLAAVKVLFHRYSGQDDILVGTPVAGRRMVETEGLIGCFLNTLVLRTDLGGEPSFRDLLTRVREVTLGAYSHQDVPFEAVLASLPQQRDLSRTPLFQVMVNLLNLPNAEMSLPGLALEGLRAGTAPSKLDMTFYVRELGDGLCIELVYNADLFDAARMEAVLSQLEAFLDQALERPDEPVGALSLVTAAARAVLPNPAVELAASWEGPVHASFARWGQEMPDALAVVDAVEPWSYGGLLQQSRRLAHALAAAGVGRGDVVALWAHRSAALVWGVLGVLEAGAAFLLLDPTYPAEKLAARIRRVCPRAWLHLEAAGPLPAALEELLAGLGCPRLGLPARALESGAFREWPSEPLGIEVGPEDLAYVAFTSGSTGEPKCLLGSHRPLAHFLGWHARTFGLERQDRFSLLSGLSHDPLLRDLFTPLVTGAVLAIPEPDLLAEPGRLLAWLARERVSVIHLTPALGQMLSLAAPRHGCPTCAALSSAATC
jgi:non-ribosomal peptide synthetase component F